MLTRRHNKGKLAKVGASAIQILTIEQRIILTSHLTVTGNLSLIEVIELVVQMKFYATAELSENYVDLLVQRFSC